MFSSTVKKYLPLSSRERFSDDASPEDPKESPIEDDYFQPIDDGRPRYLYLSMFLFLLSSLFLIATVTLLWRPVVPSTAQCVEELSMYSPANEAVEYREYNFDNMFPHKTKYRGPPTTELEAEWEKLWLYGETSVPGDKLAELNKGREPREWKTLPPEKGGGYAAAIMVFHQLHCLNYIRQYTWGDYYERHNMTVPLKAGAVGKRMHVDHCLEELRKTLMCYGDTTPMLVEMDPTAPLGERSDFDARHKCRNFEKLRDWMDEHLAVRWP